MHTFKFCLRGDFLASRTATITASSESEAMAAFDRLTVEDLNALPWYLSALTLEDYVDVLDKRNNWVATTTVEQGELLDALEDLEL